MTRNGINSDAKVRMLGWVFLGWLFFFSFFFKFMAVKKDADLQQFEQVQPGAAAVSFHPVVLPSPIEGFVVPSLSCQPGPGTHVPAFHGEGGHVGWTTSRVGSSPKQVLNFFPEQKDLCLHQFLSKCTTEKIEEVFSDFHLIFPLYRKLLRSIGDDAFQIQKMPLSWLAG